MFTIFTAKIDWKFLIIMAISHYKKQRIMLLARLNLGLASEDLVGQPWSSRSPELSYK